MPASLSFLRPSKLILAAFCTFIPLLGADLGADAPANISSEDFLERMQKMGREAESFDEERVHVRQRICALLRQSPLIRELEKELFGFDAVEHFHRCLSSPMIANPSTKEEENEAFWQIQKALASAESFLCDDPNSSFFDEELYLQKIYYPVELKFIGDQVIDQETMQIVEQIDDLPVAEYLIDQGYLMPQYLHYEELTAPLQQWLKKAFGKALSCCDTKKVPYHHGIAPLSLTYAVQDGDAPHKREIKGYPHRIDLTQSLRDSGLIKEDLEEVVRFKKKELQRSLWKKKELSKHKKSPIRSLERLKISSLITYKSPGYYSRERVLSYFRPSADLTKYLEGFDADIGIHCSKSDGFILDLRGPFIDPIIRSDLLKLFRATRYHNCCKVSLCLNPISVKVVSNSIDLIQNRIDYFNSLKAPNAIKDSMLKQFYPLQEQCQQILESEDGVLKDLHYYFGHIMPQTHSHEYEGPLYVLLNEETSGDAEVLAAILQSHGATLVGRPSAGRPYDCYLASTQISRNLGLHSYFRSSVVYQRNQEGEFRPLNYLGLTPDIMIEESLDEHCYCRDFLEKALVEIGELEAGSY